MRRELGLELQRLLAGAAAPRASTREGRVELLVEVAEALVRAGSEASLFVGGALLARLQSGGDLERDYLRISAQRGSHLTVEALYRRLKSSSTMSNRSRKRR